MIVTELHMYKALPKLDMEGDPLRWWATQGYALPVLSFMARQHLAIPASSAEVERLFSAVGRRFSNRRKPTKDTTLESLLFGRNNK